MTELPAPKLAIYQDAIEPYFQNILKFTLTTSHKNKTRISPFKRQKFITKQMRFIIFNWLLENAQCFTLKLRTLLLAGNIMDRYLSMHTIAKEKFQLIGVTSLFIASKYEDVNPPSLKQMGFMLDEWHENGDILATEADIIVALNFDLSVQLVIDIAEIMLKVLKIEDRRIIDLVNEILLVLACYHFIDKFEACKLSTFAITYAFRHYNLTPSGLDKICRITDCEFWYFNQKVKKVLDAMATEKLTGLDKLNKVFTCESFKF